MKTYLTYDLEKMLLKKFRHYNYDVKGNFLDVYKVQKNKKLRKTKLPKEVLISPETIGLIVWEDILEGEHLFLQILTKMLRRLF